MLFVKQVLCLNLLSACVIAEKKEDKIHTEVFNVNDPFPRHEKECTNRGILLQYFRLLADGCESDSKKPIFLDGNISFLWIDLQRRCTAKNKCNMKNFVLPTLYFRCNNNTDVLASKFDVAFSCEPLKGESVYSVTINSTAIIKDLDKPKYLVHNDVLNDSNHIVCTIKALQKTNISIQLLYVDWNMAPECDDSQENVSIGNTVYSCKNSTHIMSEQTFKTEATIEMFKKRGLVWMKWKVNIAHNLKCEIKTIVINKTKEKPSDTEVLNIPIIVVPVVALFILLVVCGLLLYRLRNARNYGDNVQSGERQKSTHEYGDYSTINENYMTSPTTTESQGAYCHVDTEMLLLQSESSTTAYKDLEKEANTLAANVYQVTLTNDDQTYAEVNKKPKLIQTQVQVNASSSQVSSSEDLSAKGDNVYAHLAQFQGKKETDNIYNS